MAARPSCVGASSHRRLAISSPSIADNISEPRTKSACPGRGHLPKDIGRHSLHSSAKACQPWKWCTSYWRCPTCDHKDPTTFFWLALVRASHRSCQDIHGARCSITMLMQTQTAWGLQKQFREAVYGYISNNLHTLKAEHISCGTYSHGVELYWYLCFEFCM